MADKLTTQEENGEKVFTVELEPGSEVTMQTADTYVDKNIKVKAKSVDPITYTGGTGINVDNDNYTISVDDTVVTVSKLASGELQAIDLDPTSSHVISQVVTAIDGFIGPAVALYTTDPETDALNPTQYGTFGVQTDGLEHPIVGLTADTEDAKLVLGSYQERPQYYNLTDSNFYDISLVGDITGTTVDGKWTSLTINGTTASIGGGSESSYGDAEVKTLLSGQTVQSIDLDPSSSHVNAQLVAASDLMMSQSYALYTTDDQGKFQSNASGGLYVEDDTDYKMVAVVAEKENLNVVLASHNQRPYYIDLSKDEDPHPQEGIALLSDLITSEGTITVRQAQIISMDPIVFEPTDDQKAIFNDAMKMTLYVDADDLDGKRYVMQRQYDESGNKVRYTSVTPYIEQRGDIEATLGTTTTSLVYDKATERFQVSQFLQWFVDGTAEDGIWKSMTIGNTTANFPQGGGAGEPDAYIKNASVSGKTLTLTKKDNTTVTFTDTNTEYTQGTGIKITGTEISTDDTVVATKTDLQDKINRDEAEETIVSILTAMHLNRYYTGANVPQSSLGQDGDIYLQE